MNRRNIIKKLSLFLALVMILSMVPMSASAVAGNHTIEGTAFYDNDRFDNNEGFNNNDYYRSNWYGYVNLDGATTEYDYGYIQYYNFISSGSADGMPDSYYSVKATSSNDDVVVADTSYSTSGGYMKVTFTPGSNTTDSAIVTVTLSSYYKGYNTNYDSNCTYTLTYYVNYAQYGYVEPEVEVETTYSLNYAANAGTGVTVDNMPGSSIIPSTDDSVDFTVSSFKPERSDGYTFQGWSTASNGTVEYFSGDSITLSSSDPSVTLYAVWAEDADVTEPEVTEPEVTEPEVDPEEPTVDDDETTDANGDYIWYNDDPDAEGSDTGNVEVTYEQDVTDTYKVTVEWGSLEFTYTDSNLVWNVDTLSWDETEEDATGWSCEDGANEITVTNYSSQAVDVAFEVTELFDITVTVEADEFTLRDATSGTETTQTVTVTPDGYDEAIKDATSMKIATVTVVLSAA